MPAQATPRTTPGRFTGVMQGYGDVSERNDDFYRDLPPFGRFDDFTDFAAYAPVPSDWVVISSDVVGSTKAIAAGRYKDVNMVGAASITAVLNACGDVDVPFIFGGDGGTLVVPASCRTAAENALRRLQARSATMFGLDLRAAAIPASALRAMGRDLRIRKYELSRRNYLAMFAGGGIERAEALLKQEDGADYRLAPDETASAPDLEGLSCRWEPLRPRNGRMLSLIVQATAEEPAIQTRTLANVLARITSILGHELPDSAPASAESMRFHWPPRGLQLEARATAGERPYWRRYLAVLTSSAIQWCCERFSWRAGEYDPAVYRHELRANTDYRKFDGTLRTVLDVTADQAAAIEASLETDWQAGRLLFGSHLAEQALMTCLVFNLAQSEHVHFIDGADGGFTAAATQLKARAGQTTDPTKAKEGASTT